jgi:glycerol-3-phosphate O-acyltransferase/dihydroxyacetone phosphate acyltransferase
MTDSTDLADSTDVERRGWARCVARWVVRRYYPRMEFIDAERIPQTGPVVLCSNHSNSMLDPVIVGITAQRPVRFMAKAPLFELPVFGPLMFALGMVPAFRGKDDTKQVRRNLESLDIGAKILLGGQAMGIFPEGMCTDRAHLEQIRTGAARMALQAVEEGAGPVQIVPLGVAYERKEAFRSSVLVRVAEPIRVADMLVEHENSIPKARRAVTQELEARLKEVAIHLEEPEWEPWLDDLETIVPASSDDSSATPLRRRKAIADAINYFLETDRPRAESVASEIESYRDNVRATGLRVDSPVLETSRLRIFGTLLWGVVWLALLFVPALLGTLFHLVPFVVVRRIASWADQPGRVTTATSRLMIGLPIYLLWYAVATIGLVVYAPPIALTWLLVAPFAGVLALYYWRRARDEAFLLYHEVRAMIGGKNLRRLREQLAELRQRLTRLSEDYAKESRQ